MWIKNEIRIGSDDFGCQTNVKGNITEVELPYIEDWAKLLESDSITIDNETYTIQSVRDVAERHEKLLILCIKQEATKHERKSSKRSKTN
tara:strand:+ start:567 stop:836 length:270 start_codon:yes stop_codon:yes gene_type:complete